VLGLVLARELRLLEASLKPLEITTKPDMPRGTFFSTVKAADIGVSPAELAVAETGTVIIAASDESERLVTALPKIHVVVVPRSRLVSSLADAEPRISRFLAGASRGVVVSLISGPSKTADIGGMLVVGVHGPGELHVCLLDQELREES